MEALITAHAPMMPSEYAAVPCAPAEGGGAGVSENPPPKLQSTYAPPTSTAIATDEFGVLSIDVDGCDYWIWDSLKTLNPAVIVIEHNPTIPNHVLYVQAKDTEVRQGSSLLVSGIVPKKDRPLDAKGTLVLMSVESSDCSNVP